MLVPCLREPMYVALPHLNSDPKVPDVANLQLHTYSNQLSHIHTYIHTYIQTDGQTDRQTDRQPTERQTDTNYQKHTQNSLVITQWHEVRQGLKPDSSTMENKSDSNLLHN